MNPIRMVYLVILVLVLAACSQSPISVVLDPQIAETQKLTFPASDIQAYGYFGSAVAVDGDFMVVGAFLANRPTGNPGRQGAAYLYQKDITEAGSLLRDLWLVMVQSLISLASQLPSVATPLW
jgi:FG-GAP repeat